jgi:YbgC/YbaW family acyl-CoA thioester hydrolase
MTAPEIGKRVVARREVLLTYADTDAAGILYYAAWFPWMERMGVEWLYDNGFRYDTMLAEHGAAAVTRATTCEYLSQVTIYERVEIRMFVDTVGQRSYRLGFTMIRDHDQTVVARSTMSLVTIDGEGKPAQIPATLEALLRA